MNGSPFERTPDFPKFIPVTLDPRNSLRTLQRVDPLPTRPASAKARDPNSVRRRLKVIDGRVSPLRRRNIIPLSDSNDLAFLGPLSASGKQSLFVAASFNQASRSGGSTHTRRVPGFSHKCLGVVIKHNPTFTDISSAGNVPSPPPTRNSALAAGAFLLSFALLGASGLPGGPVHKSIRRACVSDGARSGKAAFWRASLRSSEGSASWLYKATTPR